MTFTFKESLSASSSQSLLCLCISGTSCFAPPEWYSRHAYSAGPTTVWQLGIVLHEILHRESFRTREFKDNKPKISNKLSKGMKNMLIGKHDIILFILVHVSMDR